jgi:hypothetical protein
MIIMPYGWPRPIAAAHRPGRLLAPHSLPCHGELAVQLLIGATAVPGSVRRHVSAYERAWRGTGVTEPLHAREVQASSIVAGAREGAPFRLARIMTGRYTGLYGDHTYH